jgi:hypothetical protein
VALECAVHACLEKGFHPFATSKILSSSGAGSLKECMGVEVAAGSAPMVFYIHKGKRTLGPRLCCVPAGAERIRIRIRILGGPGEGEGEGDADLPRLLIRFGPGSFLCFSGANSRAAGLGLLAVPAKLLST